MEKRYPIFSWDRIPGGHNIVNYGTKECGKKVTECEEKVKEKKLWTYVYSLKQYSISLLKTKPRLNRSMTMTKCKDKPGLVLFGGTTV